MDSEQTSLSAEQFLGVVRRRLVWIVLCVVLVGGAAYVYTKREAKKYTATAALAFNNSQLDEQIAGLSAGNSGLTPLAQQQSNVELIRVGDIATTTAALLGHGLTAAKISSSLSIAAKGETNIIEVSSVASSPELATAIANTYAIQFVRHQQGANLQFFKSALALVKKQLAGLPPVQRVGTDGLDLQNRAQTLGLLVALGYNNVELAQEAGVPAGPSSPKVHKDTAIGAILGLLLGLGLAFLLEHFDRRIREPEELEAIYGLPMLGTVPKSAAIERFVPQGSEGVKQVALPAAEAEAFSLIRAHLRFFNVDRDLRTVIIASPAPGDGKTTIARHLAEAAARLGSRVLLMELDLRHPTLGHQLGIQSGPGLAGALIGAISVEEATETVALQVAPGEGATGRTLDVLVAGAVLPPNPGELLDSRAMGALIARTKSAYDLVVFDTPPLTAVSDAFPLLTRVDGVVIVGRVGHSRRDEAQHLHQVLAVSEAPLLGVIANGVKVSGRGSYAEPGRDEQPSSAITGSANGTSASEGITPQVRS